MEKGVGFSRSNKVAQKRRNRFLRCRTSQGFWQASLQHKALAGQVVGLCTEQL